VKRLPGKAGAALAACVAIVALLAAGPAAASTGAKVSITDSGFKPATVQIKQWHVVTWTNKGKKRHGVASDTGKTLESGTFGPGQAYGNLFKQAGTFTYHDLANPSFTGRVVVVAAPKPTVTGPKPPSGKKPKGFHPQPTITSATPENDSGNGGGTNWTAIGAGLGVAVVVLAAAAYLMLRRRGSTG
jgi:plastocyanin